MGILLVTAVEMEMQACLEGVMPKTEAAGLLNEISAGGPVRARLNGHDTELLVSGIGIANAAFSLGVALERLRHVGRFPVGVLNLGIAGSYNLSAAPVGGSVLVTEEFLPEYGVFRSDGTRSEALRFAQASADGLSIFDRIDAGGEEALGAMGLGRCRDAVSGGAVTLASVSGDSLRAEQIYARTQALAENMEGFAYALGCFQARSRSGGRPVFAEIRTISNQAGKRPPESWNIPAALEALSFVAGELFGHTGRGR